MITKRFGDKGKSCSAYELSTYGATLNYLRKHFGAVVASEYFPGLESGIVYQRILNQDVQGLTFSDASFDLVTSNQVFEHVPDDMPGYRECCRVLKPGGSLVFSVPLHDIPETRQLAVLKNGHIEWLGRPEFHDSRLGGAKSAPTFWYHSIHDITSRVKEAGFSDVQLEEVMIASAQAAPSLVVHAIK
ncbi:MAG: methyltransferase domain-containing protein [Nitrosomonadales bacterium]|nr:methyltransferase domain-containing protein [Nitrosomonadales bacterium]